MTLIEIIEFIIIWLFVANFICRKRQWYKAIKDDADRVTAVIFAFLFTPIILLIALIREFIFRDWEYYKKD